MKSCKGSNFRKSGFLLFWPCWGPSPAQSGTSHRAIYSAFVRTPWVYSWKHKRPLSSISIDPLLVHLPSGSKIGKTWKKWQSLMGPKIFSRKVHILYVHYRVIGVWDLEFRGPPLWKCSRKFFVLHRTEKITIFNTFENLTFYLNMQAQILFQIRIPYTQ